MSYIERITDKQLRRKLNALGGVLITGPKGCGKTTTGKHFAKSIVEFQDENERENLILIANTKPSDLLIGEKPRLFDEWQDAPKIWGAIRKSIDDEQLIGAYILTGSSSQKVKTPHTGTLRISNLKMYPMSSFESKDSNGQVSLMGLFENPNAFVGCKSDLSIDDIKFLVCRGGWPRAITLKNKDAKLEIARDLFKQTCEVDISNIDNVKRNSRWAKAIMSSYARNICTLATAKTIMQDVNSNYEISKDAYYEYINALNDLCIIEDVDSWNASIRSKTAIRSSHKRNFIDPSLAAAALEITPDYFIRDYKTLGFLFESLVLRDLKVYSSAYDGHISYYNDRYGLEADAVLRLGDGRYALIEIKLGQTEVEEGAKHLNKIERLIKEYNENETQVPLRLPDLKIIITGTQYGYRREDGVYVIPIGCLKD